MERQTVALEPLIYDKETGLPKLPDGFAWRVDENPYSHYDEENPEEVALVLRIASRKVEELTWFGKLIGTKPTVNWNVSDHQYSDVYAKCANNADDIRSAATQAYNKRRDAELKRAEMKKFIGLYPPKSLL
jgi:hypothetical protein